MLRQIWIRWGWELGLPKIQKDLLFERPFPRRFIRIASIQVHDRHMAELDLDQDGVISRDELLDAMKVGSAGESPFLAF
jgi:hypothetical protein